MARQMRHLATANSDSRATAAEACDKLQIKTMIYHTVKNTVSVIKPTLTAAAAAASDEK